jgi:hypothetical protein
MPPKIDPCMDRLHAKWRDTMQAVMSFLTQAMPGVCLLPNKPHGAG